MVRAKCHSSFPWSEENQKTSHRLLVSLIKITRVASKSKPTVKYPDLPSTVKFVPHSEELPVSQHLENLTFSDDNSDSDEKHGQQEVENVYCNPKLQTRCSSSQPHFLTPGDLNDFTVI
jgi:hypothetical protein